MTSSVPDLEPRLALALNIAHQARAITVPAFHRVPSYRNKLQSDDEFDPVTKTDIATEKRVRALITEQFPDDGILGEEFSETAGSSPWSWTLDPIDGTRAFIAGVPVWSLLIAICKNGQPVAGLMDFPILDRTYIGDGKRSICLNGQIPSVLQTRKCTNVENAVLSCTEPMAMFTPAQLTAYEQVRQQARFSRLGLDAYAYALLAEGKIDVVLDACLQPYDTQALMPIIKGAGGQMTQWDKGPAEHGGAVVAVGNPELLESLYPILAQAET